MRSGQTVRVLKTGQEGVVVPAMTIHPNDRRYIVQIDSECHQFEVHELSMTNWLLPRQR